MINMKILLIDLIKALYGEFFNKNVHINPYKKSFDEIDYI